MLDYDFVFIQFFINTHKIGASPPIYMNKLARARTHNIYYIHSKCWVGAIVFPLLLLFVCTYAIWYYICMLYVYILLALFHHHHRFSFWRLIQINWLWYMNCLRKKIHFACVWHKIISRITFRRFVWHSAIWCCYWS